MPGNKANSNGKWTQTRKVLGFSDCGFTSHGFSRRRKNAPMNNIAAAVPWEHGENLLSALRKPCSSVSKAIYLVRLWWRRWDWRWFHVCEGSFHQSHSSSPSVEALLPCKWTMERRPLEVCCYIATYTTWAVIIPCLFFFEEIPLARRKLTPNPFACLWKAPPSAMKRKIVEGEDGQETTHVGSAQFMPLETEEGRHIQK